MLSLQFGDIVAVDFPYEEDGEQSKVRPGLILGETKGQFLVAKITSVNKNGYGGTVPLDPDTSNNLRKKSWVDLSQRAFRSPVYIPKKIGTLSCNDLQKITNLLSKMRKYRI